MKSKKLTADQSTFEQMMDQHRIDYQVFQTEVPLKTGKWSKNKEATK